MSFDGASNVDEKEIIPSGIDIYICRGPELETIRVAIEACGIAWHVIVGPDESIIDRLELLSLPVHVVMYALDGGDFEFKVDVNTLIPFDGTGFARALASMMRSAVVVPDERKPDPISALRLSQDCPDVEGTLDEAEPDGMVFVALTAVRLPDDPVIAASVFGLSHRNCFLSRNIWRRRRSCW